MDEPFDDRPSVHEPRTAVPDDPTHPKYRDPLVLVDDGPAFAKLGEVEHE